MWTLTHIYYELEIIFNPAYTTTWSSLDLVNPVINPITGDITSFDYSKFDDYVVQPIPLQHHELSTTTRNKIMYWLDKDFSITVNYDLPMGGSVNPDNYQVNILHGIPITVQPRYAGRPPMKNGNGLVEVQRGVGDHGIHGSKRKRPAKLSDHVAHRGAEAVEGPEQVKTGIMDLSPFLGQKKSATTALAKAQAQAFLQMAHVGGYRGLAHPECDLRSGKTVAVHNGRENPQQP